MKAFYSATFVLPCLTIDGLRTRDRLVFDACRDRNLPVVVAMSGGYALDVDAIVLFTRTRSARPWPASDSR